MSVVSEASRAFSSSRRTPTTEEPKANGKEWAAKGYPRLAKLMGAKSETAIFRRFGMLNSLNLLSLHAEILDLEEQLQIQIAEDNASTDPKVANLSVDFCALHRSDSSQKRQLINDIRPKLKEYNDLLIQHAAVEKLQQPDDRNFDFLRDWLIGEEEGAVFLNGHEGSAWEEGHRKDLITINSKSSADQATIPRWLNPRLTQFYYHWRPQIKKPKYSDLESGRFFDSDDSTAVKVGRFVSRILSTIVASLLPALAILALNKIDSIEQRIIMTIAFTTAFGLCLAGFTNVNLKEIYTATATFAAVEVVFIGTASTSGTVGTS